MWSWTISRELASIAPAGEILLVLLEEPFQGHGAVRFGFLRPFPIGEEVFLHATQKDFGFHAVIGLGRLLEPPASETEADLIAIRIGIEFEPGHCVAPQKALFKLSPGSDPEPPTRKANANALLPPFCPRKGDGKKKRTCIDLTQVLIP